MFLTNWAVPLGLLLVHHQVKLGVETLKMITGGSSSWNLHPHLAKRTGQGNLATGRGNFSVLIRQLFLDQRLGIVWVPDSLGPELLQQVLMSQVLHLVHGDGVGLADLGGPGDRHRVLLGRDQLAEVSDVDWAWRSSWLGSWLGGKRIGQRTNFVVDPDTERSGEGVTLLTGDLEKGESQLDLMSILDSAVHSLF